MNDPSAEHNEITQDPPRPDGETIAEDDRPPQSPLIPVPNVLRYREAIAALAAALLIVCSTGTIVRWMTGEFRTGQPVSMVVCRGPGGRIDTFIRGTTIAGALEQWGIDTTGIGTDDLDGHIHDGDRIEIVDGRTERVVRIDEMDPAERFTLGLDFDINRASITDLALIPGIGEATARRVFEYRRIHGDFMSAEDLLRVPDLGKKRARLIMRYVSFPGEKGSNKEKEIALGSETSGLSPTPSLDTSKKMSKADPPLDINRANLDQLTRIPGIGEKTAEKIIDYRRAHGPFTRIDDLEKIDGIGKKKARKIGKYVIIPQPSAQ